MQTHNTTAPRKAEPYYRTIGTYVQIKIDFPFGAVWHVGHVVAVRGNVSTINVRGKLGSVAYEIDATCELDRLRPFVVAG